MKTISVYDLKTRLENQEPVQVIDIREEWEVEEGSFACTCIPMAELAKSIQTINTDKPVVIYCKSGKRSKIMVEYLTHNYNLKNLYALEGGIQAWQKNIDQSITVE